VGYRQKCGQLANGGRARNAFHTVPRDQEALSACRDGCDWGCGGRASTVKRTTSEPKRSPTSSSDPSAKNDPNAEVTVQDSGTTFRLRLNLVHVVTVKRSFDSTPGKYLVRQVIRDSEGSQMAARNGAVDIPN
jgi:hypothetical protein